MSVPARVLNDLFTKQVNTAEGREKTAEYAGTYIRDRLREVSFCRKIIPPENVTRADCQVSVNTDTLVKIVEVEPQSKAMTISFRGTPQATYIRGDRLEAAFYTISSQVFQKSEQELLAYTMPITKVIEENSVKDIQEVEDREFTTWSEAAVQFMQTTANGGTATALNASGIQAGTVVEFSIRKGELARAATTNDATVRPVQKPDYVNLFKMLDNNRLRSERILQTEGDWDDILQWTVEDFGDRLASETTVDGYKYSTLLGRMVIRTIKSDILRPGNIYVFTRPEFFGKFFVLNNTKFYIDKIANFISFQAWEDISMTIANIASVRKVELYSGDANPTTNADGLLTNFIPVTEDALGKQNNSVAAGGFFPTVSAF